MSELQQELFEKQMRSLAQGLDYPRTPDIAGTVMARLPIAARPRLLSRRLAWSLTVLLILFTSLMLIPPVRAAVIEFIQVGVVRIFRAEPTPLPPLNQEVPGIIVPVTGTPAPTATSQPLIPILESLAGEMTLEEAQKTVNYPILLPSYPADLGPPDRVFVQEVEGKMTVLVWIDPRRPDRVSMSLHFIPLGSWAIDKFQPAQVQETAVNGQKAVWAVGPYPLRLRNSDIQYMRLIEGRVLIWKDKKLTYRLETDLSLEEALKIAESLEPLR